MAVLLVAEPFTYGEQTRAASPGKKTMMTADKARKIATRQRMAETGEPYSVARHAVQDERDTEDDLRATRATARLTPAWTLRRVTATPRPAPWRKPTRPTSWPSTHATWPSKRASGPSGPERRPSGRKKPPT